MFLVEKNLNVFLKFFWDYGKRRLLVTLHYKNGTKIFALHFELKLITLKLINNNCIKIIYSVQYLPLFYNFLTSSALCQGFTCWYFFTRECLFSGLLFLQANKNPPLRWCSPRIPKPGFSHKVSEIIPVNLKWMWSCLYSPYVFSSSLTVLINRFVVHINFIVC